MLTINVKRDSVAVGDDTDAPHLYSFEMEKSNSFRLLFQHLAARRYLATVSGEGHSWQVKISGKIVAEFIANNDNPEASRLLEIPISEWADNDTIELYFTYSSSTF